mgnify:CR=1 FL=1
MTDLIRREDAVKAVERDLSNTDLSAQTQNVIVDSIRCLPEFAADVSDTEKDAEIAKLREHLTAVCEAAKDLRDTAFCDVIVALDCPRGGCDCCTCEAVGKFDAAITEARKAVGE